MSALPSRALPSLGRVLGALAALAAVLAGVLVLATYLGAESTSSLPPETAREVLELRLTRVLLAAIVGAALGVAGAALQALVENALADPFVLGLSGGAAIGATLAIALGSAGLFAGSVTGLAAFAGAAGSALLVFSLGRVGGRLVPERLVLVGVVFNAFASAVVLAVQSFASPDLLQALFSWLLGSVGYPEPRTLVSGAIAVGVGVVVLAWQAPGLNLLSLGELDAHALGLDVRRTRAIVFAAAALLVGASVSLAGIIGFVGLLVPHVVRLTFGADHRIVVPGSALAGAAFLVLADLGTRLFFLVARTEPPVGMATALVGAPLFLWLLVRRRTQA